MEVSHKWGFLSSFPILLPLLLLAQEFTQRLEKRMEDGKINRITSKNKGLTLFSNFGRPKVVKGNKSVYVYLEKHTNGESGDRKKEGHRKRENCCVVQRKRRREEIVGRKTMFDI